MKKGSITKQKIINKSLQLFSVKGYYHTSLNDILEACQLTKGGIYGHFKSKKDIWYAVYYKAVHIWKKIVFKDIENIEDPILRLQKALENDIQIYLGTDIFEGGCFFLNMLVELSGQSDSMSRHVLNGMTGFSGLIKKWLIEADDKKLLKPNLNMDEISDFIITILNGCAALYASTRNPQILKITLSQINYYLEHIKK